VTIPTSHTKPSSHKITMMIQRNNSKDMPPRPSIEYALFDARERCDGTTSKISEYRSVTWGGCCIFEIPGIDTLTTEEIKQVWLTVNDKAGIEDDCMRTVEMIEDGLTIMDEDGVCARGLERHANFGNELTESNRRHALNCVLGTQAFSMSSGMGSSSSGWISESYRSVSAPCAENAHILATRDERDAR
jgi:hypothetical protein